MKNIDGKKVERVVRQIYNLFEKEKITGNEGASIAGMIMVNASSQVTLERLKR